MKNHFLIIILGIIFAVLLITISTSTAVAVPAAPIEHILYQPDGSTFSAYQWGDEWVNGYETQDGYTILKTDDNWWVYAEINTDGTLSPIFREGDVIRVGEDLPSGTPLYIRPSISVISEQTPFTGNSIRSQNSGTHPTLVLLAEFSDREGTYKPEDFSASMFGTSNSVKDFYLDASFGKLIISPLAETHGTANDGIVGWLKLDYKHPNTGEDTDSDNQQIVKDALIASDDHVDYATYDKNGDGYISTDELHIIVIVAGFERSYSNSTPSVWGHRWSLDGVGAPTLDGKIIGESSHDGGYSQFGEIQGDHKATIGIMAHELGHDLSWPDLYDIDQSSSGVGDWSIMSGGNWNKTGSNEIGSSPALPDAWLKYYQGWISPIEVHDTVIEATIAQAETSPTAYLLRPNTDGVDWEYREHSGSGEYFLVENRQLTGYDSGLPGCGLLVWHIDESVTSTNNANTNENKPLVKLMEADGLNELKSKTDQGDAGDPFPGSTSNRSFNYNTNPNSRLYNGNDSLVAVTEISNCSANMKADLTFGFSITSPVEGSPAHAGSYNNPTKVVIHVTKPVRRLTKSNFSVYIGGYLANIVTLYESSQDYVLEVTPPNLSSNGLYSLSVNIDVAGRTMSENEIDSILYANQANVDVDLIIDRSGSMSGTPLTTAKAAASQFVDYMQLGDMVGVVSFESSARVDYSLTEIEDSGLIEPVFSDDMESGTDKWIPESPWGRTLLRFNSPLHSWTDSPLGNYANDINISLRTANTIALPSEAFSAVLRFSTRYDIEYAYDNGFVEVSTDGGINWTQIGAPITGTNTIWHTRGYNLSNYIGEEILLRFRLETDSWDTAQGWFIDDVMVGVAKNPDVKIEAKAAIDSLVGGGGTNIGAGLQTGQNQLTSLGNANHPWSMVLLTDGNGTITNETISAIAESKTVVHTIGLGNGVDQNLLLNIATQTGGTYNYAPTPEQLSEIYNTISGTVSNRQTLLSATGTVDENMVDSKIVVVDSTVSDAIFSLSWADSSSRINMVLVKPDGTVINPEIAENNEFIDFVSGGTYQYYRVVSPALIPGVWEMEIHGGTITESEGKELRAVESGINYAVQVTAVSSLTSQLFFDRDSYSLVEPIKLVMSISDSQPILGATVDVDVSAPSQTASQLIPMSEWIEFNGDLIPDPQRLEEITAANQTASDTLSLFDDGKHGDGLANDGVYANLYMKTYEPGTYKFTVKASGTSTMGDQFERYGELSTYIEDDPERTPTFTYIPLVIK